MAHLIEVAFKGNRKEFFLWGDESPPPVRAAVVVEADRGEDLGRVNAIGDLAQLRARGCTHGIGNQEPTLKALRLASAEEVRRLAEVREQDETARRDAMGFVKTHALPMKLTDAEWRWDRRKLTMYFSADRRVDFRALVRDLAGRFRTRIELKQIGVRDEAKRLDGVGRCGRQYCSASWLPELRPVNLGLAKIQKLSLNPTQISGACGRLMCCLRYEHEWYVETRRRFPKEGKVVTTALGEEKVVMNDLFRERVTLRKVADGEARVIPLDQLNKELRGEPVETDAAVDMLPNEDWSDEILSMTDTVERPIPTRPPRPSERPVTLQRAPQTGPPAARSAPPAPREERKRDDRKRDERKRDEPKRDEPKRDDAKRNDGGRDAKPRSDDARRDRPRNDRKRGDRRDQKPQGERPGGQPPAERVREQRPSEASSEAAEDVALSSPAEEGGANKGPNERPRSRRRRGRRGGRRGGGGPPGSAPDGAPSGDGGGDAPPPTQGGPA